MKRIDIKIFQNDVLQVAPALLGKYLVRNQNGIVNRYLITEVEAYRGEEDQACHASKGRTKRTEIMYFEGGVLYVYLIYGMYWMLNIVTGKKENPQAVLIRGIQGIDGPGKLTRQLSIDGSFNGKSLQNNQHIWIEDNIEKLNFVTTPRIGIEYAGEPWKNKLWRFVLKQP